MMGIHDLNWDIIYIYTCDIMKYIYIYVYIYIYKGAGNIYI